MRIDLPGNLLLFGEYAVTLPGAIGIAVATEPRIEIAAKSNQTGLRFFGTFENDSYAWSLGDPVSDKLSLLKMISIAVQEAFGALPNSDITINTSQLSYPDGRKKGMGSSAAVAGGLVYTLIRMITGKSPQLLEEVFPIALKCHRDFQGSRGSGYDVITSLLGGAGLFVGGLEPVWRPIECALWPFIYLVRGDAAVRTSGAVEKFDHFCRHSPKYAHIFLNLATRCSLKFAAAASEEEKFNAVVEAARINRWIGRRLGVPSEDGDLKKKLDYYRERKCPGKALGSGGEIAAIFSATEQIGNDLMPLEIAKEGLRCFL